MRRVKVEIRAPIWNGGRPSIGIADWKLKNADEIEAEITYTTKDGNRSYPGKYVILVSELHKYPTQTVKGGVTLFVAPLSAWRWEE